MKFSFFLFVFLFLIATIVTGAGYYYVYQGQNELFGGSLISTGSNFMQIVGIIFLIQHSTIYKTRYFRILQGVFSLVLVAACFKIEHWNGADTLIMLSYLALALTYTARFVTKKPITLNDILKWLWAVCLLTGIALTILHELYGMEVKTISLGLLVLVVGHTVFLRLFKKEPDGAQGVY